MSTTEPIRDRKSLKKFKDYYRTQKPDPRNYALVVLGLNTHCCERTQDRHLSRYQAYRIIQAITQAVPIEGHISCHSLRKTFGYHAWKQGADPVVIMLIYKV